MALLGFLGSALPVPCSASLLSWLLSMLLLLSVVLTVSVLLAIVRVVLISGAVVVRVVDVVGIIG